MSTINQGYTSLQSEKLDVLRKLGNSGASEALEMMLGKPMSMDVPAVQIVPFNNITDILGGPEKIVVGILLNMSGDLTGNILLIQNPSDAYRMACLLTMKSADEADIPKIEQGLFDEMDRSALQEIANILSGAYLNAISTLTGLSVIPSVPDLIIDMAGAIMSVPAIAYGEFGDSVLFLKTSFTDNDQSVSGHFFLIPSQDSYDIMMKALGF